MKNINKNLDSCKKGNHNFVVIMSKGTADESQVVRWCECCGSIVIDVDYDNRTNPGAIMRLRSPKYSPKFQ